MKPSYAYHTMCKTNCQNQNGENIFKDSITVVAHVFVFQYLTAFVEVLKCFCPTLLLNTRNENLKAFFPLLTLDYQQVGIFLKNFSYLSISWMVHLRIYNSVEKIKNAYKDGKSLGLMCCNYSFFMTNVRADAIMTVDKY